jgi:hypothetical protein
MVESIPYFLRRVFLMGFLLLITQLGFGQVGRKAKKPASKSKKVAAKPAAAPKAQTPVPSTPPDIRFLYLDLFGGYGKNTASGAYLEYQKTYYETANPDHRISGSFRQFSVWTLGLQARIQPFRKDPGIASYFSANIGFSVLRRGFSHDVVLTNSTLDYLDQTKITETYDATFLGTHFLVRGGRKLFLETGISADAFLNGTFSRELMRTTSGEKAYEGGFSTSETWNNSLGTTVMKPFSLSWVLAGGYQFSPLCGESGFFTSQTGHFLKKAPIC